MTTSLRILAYKPRPEPQTIRMERLITCEPLELEYLYTVLSGHQVTLLDGMTDGRDALRVAGEIDAQVVLITAFITNVDRVAILTARLAALERPPWVFVGGPHAEVVPEHFYGPGVDGVFFADQLTAVAQVVARVAAGKPFDDVPGGAYRVAAGDEGYRRVEAPPTPPAQLPVPRRVLLESQPDRYFYLYYRRCASVKTAFGCNERCNFCFCTRMHGGRYGPRPMDQVVDEIAALPVRNVFILDDNFLTTAARVQEFCDAVRERSLDKEFIAYGVASFIAAHPELMAQLRAVGLTGIIVGFESIREDELASMHKTACTADNERTVEICRELDIELFALFIVQPSWRPADFRRLARYVRERAIAFATFATATAFPGTELSPAPVTAGPGGGGWWRYDLLRLHEDPQHMTRMGFYLRLLWLYMVPSFNAESRRRQLRRYGLWGLVKAGLHSWIVGIEYLVKLWLWR